MFDAFVQAVGRRVAPRKQSEHGPGGLRRRAGRFDKSVVVVTGAAFAPAAIGVLNTAEPFAGAQHAHFAIADTSALQASQRQERSVDVIDAPASVPAPVGLLSALEKFNSALNRWMAGLHAAGD